MSEVRIRAWYIRIFSQRIIYTTGVACQQGTLTLPDTWFHLPLWDLLVLQLLRPDSLNLPYLYSTFHLEYPLVLSRFCLYKNWLLCNEYTGTLRTEYENEFLPCSMVYDLAVTRYNFRSLEMRFRRSHNYQIASTNTYS